VENFEISGMKSVASHGYPPGYHWPATYFMLRTMSRLTASLIAFISTLAWCSSLSAGVAKLL